MQNIFQANDETIDRSSRSLLQTPDFLRSAIAALFVVFFCCLTSSGQTPERIARSSVRRQAVMRPSFDSNLDGNSNIVVKAPAVVSPFERFLGEVNPIESDMILDAKDNRFERYTLFDAALIAAGTTDSASGSREQPNARAAATRRTDGRRLIAKLIPPR